MAATVNDGASSARQSMTLQVLSPSLEPQNRHILHGLPLDSKVLDIKMRLFHEIPARPPPTIQRLIYRGRVLSNDQERVTNIFPPTDAHIHSIHLVLPPSNPIPKPRNAASPQPAPTPPSVSQEPSLPVNQPRSSTLTHSVSDPHISSLAQISSQMTTMSHHMAALEAQITSVAAATQAAAGITVGNTIYRNAANPHGVPTVAVNDAGQRHSWNGSVDIPLGNVRYRHGQYQHQQPQNIPQQPDSNSSQHSPMASVQVVSGNSVQARHQRITTLVQSVFNMEGQLRRGVVPVMQEMVQVRSQVNQLLDEQYRNPLGQRDGILESLLIRLIAIFNRADQIRVHRTRQITSYPTPITTTQPSVSSSIAQPSVYLVSSPTGHRAILIPGTNPVIQNQPTTQATPPNQPPNQEFQQLGRALATQMANRLPRQQRQPQRAENAFGRAALARTARRVWLFARLYFFCYILSEERTWFRFLLVALSVIISLIAETPIPNLLYNVLVDPVQRHLENLVPLENQHPRGRRRFHSPTFTQSLNDANTRNEPPEAPEQPAETPLRRLERALALFVASLVPGIGERHVTARQEAMAMRRTELERQRVMESMTRNANSQNENNRHQSGNANENAHEHRSTGEQRHRIENENDNGNEETDEDLGDDNDRSSAARSTRERDPARPSSSGSSRQAATGTT